MPTRSAGGNKLSKHYLERKLLDYSIEKPAGYIDKSRKINTLLNTNIKQEMVSGEYRDHVVISKQEYEELFG